jgi:ureidoglycolate lyase
MRLATILEGGGSDGGTHGTAAVVRDERLLPIAIDDPRLWTVRGIAAAGTDGLERVATWAATQPRRAWRALADTRLGPAVPDPGAIYTIGENYVAAGAVADRPPRPLVYGKAASSVAGHGATLSWDRSLTANVDAEVELGVVIGAAASAIPPERALEHVFGYTCLNDISSRDPWLDGDQWLVGKSMPGFCPVGPWVVTADDLDPVDVRLRCTIDGVAIQDGRTSQMRSDVAAIISYLSGHLELRPGDLIATGTPVRLGSPPGPERRLQPGDVVTVSIEGIGELTTTVA